VVEVQVFVGGHGAFNACPVAYPQQLGVPRFPLAADGFLLPQHLAGARFSQPRQQTEQRGFARPVGAGYLQYFPGRQRKGETAEQQLIVTLAGYIINVKHQISISYLFLLPYSSAEYKTDDQQPVSRSVLNTRRFPAAQVEKRRIITLLTGRSLLSSCHN